jgi:hypothetical protein
MATQSQLKSTLDQDKAAGGVDRRKLRIKSGDVVTVSLSCSGMKSPYRVILRFKSGLTVQREVGKIPADSALDAIAIGWKLIRQEQIVEKQGWTWLVP